MSFRRPGFPLNELLVVTAMIENQTTHPEPAVA